MSSPFDELELDLLAKPAAPSTFTQLRPFKNLRSYSSTEAFHTCPRLYQLNKCQIPGIEHGSVIFTYGHAVGAGVAEYDKTKDLGRAVFAAFCRWDLPLLERGMTRGGGFDGRCFASVVRALEKYEQLYEADIAFLSDYEFVEAEYTVALDMEDGNYHLSHIDTMFRHRSNEKILIKENKTTSYSKIERYANSDQALSYSILVRSEGQVEYTVLYTVYDIAAQEWKVYEFPKNIYAKAQWVADQVQINRTIDAYNALGFFPKRGQNCMQYNKPCRFFGQCDLPPERSWEELPLIRSFDDIEKIEPVHLKLTLTQLIDSHKES